MQHQIIIPEEYAHEHYPTHLSIFNEIDNPSEVEWSTILYILHGDPGSECNRNILNGDCLDSIPTDWIPYINNQSCQIIINTSSESWGPLYNDDRRNNDEKIDLHYILTQKALTLGINYDMITWVTGDLNAEKYLQHYDGVKVKSYCTFFFQAMNAENLLDFSAVDFLDIDEDTFNTIALCLMRDTAKEHRLYTIDKIYNDNLSAYITTTTPRILNDNTLCDNFKHHYFYYKDSVVPYDWDSFRSNILNHYTYAPHTVPDDDIALAIHRSLFSLVSESDCQSGKMFITYTTFRAILSMRPFVILGNQGILRQLKQWGFKTYDSIVDESYDDEPDMYRRVSSAIDSVVSHKLQDLSMLERFDSIKDIAKYNYNHFMNTYASMRDEYLNLFNR